MRALLYSLVEARRRLDVTQFSLILQTWPLFEEKMKSAHLSSAAIDSFKHNYSQLVAGVTGLVRGTNGFCGLL